jgi:hypothetical protein
MRRDPRNINEYRKASSDTFASVVRSFGELNGSLQGIAEEMTETSKKSVGRAIEIQAELAKKAMRRISLRYQSSAECIYLGTACLSLLQRRYRV